MRALCILPNCTECPPVYVGRLFLNKFTFSWLDCVVPVAERFGMGAVAGAVLKNIGISCFALISTRYIVLHKRGRVSGGFEDSSAKRTYASLPGWGSWASNFPQNDSEEDDGDDREEDHGDDGGDDDGNGNNDDERYINIFFDTLSVDEPKSRARVSRDSLDGYDSLVQAIYTECCRLTPHHLLPSTVPTLAYPWPDVFFLWKANYMSKGEPSIPLDYHIDWSDFFSRLGSIRLFSEGGLLGEGDNHDEWSENEGGSGSEGENAGGEQGESGSKGGQAGGERAQSQSKEEPAECYANKLYQITRKT